MDGTDFPVVKLTLHKVDIMDNGMAAEVHFGGHDLSFDPGEST